MAINLRVFNKLRENGHWKPKNCLVNPPRKRKRSFHLFRSHHLFQLVEGKHRKTKEGVELPSFVPVIAPRNKLYPIGVLLAPAPVPEVSTRITPD